MKKLHDLSPADVAVMDELSVLLTELGDFRGMVHVLEDQILRGKDPLVRAELARKVARLWEEQLKDPREAADAWRRVLRMKPADADAQAGLERAKTAMLHQRKEPAASASAEDDETGDETAEREVVPVVSPYASDEVTATGADLAAHAAVREAIQAVRARDDAADAGEEVSKKSADADESAGEGSAELEAVVADSHATSSNVEEPSNEVEGSHEVDAATLETALAAPADEEILAVDEGELVDADELIVDSDDDVEEEVKKKEPEKPKAPEEPRAKRRRN